MVRAPVGRGFDAEKRADVAFGAAGHRAGHYEFVLREELRRLRQPQDRMVRRTDVAHLPRRGVHRFDAVFGREVLEFAPKIERIVVVAVEIQQSRSAEQHRLDGVGCEAFAQDGPVGYAPGQRKVSLLVLAVAERAEVKQVEGLVPVVVGLLAECLDEAHLAGQAVEEQCREKLGALQVVQPGKISAAGIRSGICLEPGEDPFGRRRLHPYSMLSSMSASSDIMLLSQTGSNVRMTFTFFTPLTLATC